HDPIPQSLGIDPELLAHTTERARPRRWIPSRLNSHPRGSLPKLVRVLPRCCHAPHPPVDSEPPPDPGRFTARPALQRLHLRTGQLVHLAFLSGTDVVFWDKLGSGRHDAAGVGQI